MRSARASHASIRAWARVAGTCAPLFARRLQGSALRAAFGDLEQALEPHG